MDNINDKYLGKICKCISETAPCFKSQGVILNCETTGLNESIVNFEIATLDKGLCNVGMDTRKHTFEDFFSSTVMDKTTRGKLNSLYKRYIAYKESRLQYQALQSFVSSEYSEITKTINNLGEGIFYNGNSIERKLDKVFSYIKNNFFKKGLTFGVFQILSNKDIVAIKLNIEKELMRYANESSFPFLYEEYDGELFVYGEEQSEKEKAKYYLKEFKGIEKAKSNLLSVEIENYISLVDRDVYVDRDIIFRFKKKSENKKEIIDAMCEELQKILVQYKN